MVSLTLGGTAITEQSKQSSDALQHVPVFPKREENDGKLTVTMTSTRQNVR